MQDGARCAQKSKKIKKMRKNCEKVAQDLPKGRDTKTPTGYAMPCLTSDRTKIGPLNTRSNHAGGGPPRIVTQSESARGSYLETLPQPF